MQEFKADGSKKEVIFLRTEKSTKAHRSRTYIQPTSLRNIAEIVIDAREKYPWSFSATTVTKATLRSGDYALRIDEVIQAVVERKTLSNMLATLAALETYHTHLHELASYPMAALVIEAQYRDFLNPEITKPMAASRCGRALADIAARHPNLQIIFAGNRKDANVWAAQFFAACSARVHEHATERHRRGSSLDRCRRRPSDPEQHRRHRRRRTTRHHAHAAAGDPSLRPNRVVPLGSQETAQRLPEGLAGRRQADY
jgi:hypothetical protein